MRRVTVSRACGAVLIALGVMSACGSDSSHQSGTSGVWKPTTVPFDPECKDCEEIGTVTLGHMGEATLLRAPNVDDPEAQWVSCVSGILDCIEEGKDESTCVAGSTCPGPCKDDYAAHMKALGRTDVDAKWSSIKAVFKSPTSRCAAPTLPLEVSP